MQYSYVVTCSDGAEAVLSQELTDLGIDNQRSRGAVLFTGTLKQAYQVCLWARSASRLLLPLFRTDNTDLNALYEQASAFAWDEVFTPEQSFAIQSSASKQSTVHRQYLALKLKDAIVDYFRREQGRRPNVATDQPDIALHIHATTEAFEVSLDLSGDSLHRRGYRYQQTDAPLKEALAATLLLQAQWGKQPYQALLDPMCGSGTFLIEALWIAADIAPGLLRDYYGFYGWKQHDTNLWNSLWQEAQERRRVGLQRALPKVMGIDADHHALHAAKTNAEAAGVAELITWQESELAYLSNSFPKDCLGLIVTNPPYGERLGEKSSNKDLYRALGRKLREQFPLWHTQILAADIQEVDAMGLTHLATDKHHNGAILVYARQAQVPALTPAHIFQAKTHAELPAEGEDFANRLRKNLKAVQKALKAEAVTCYRVYDADLPEYNLVVDVYGSLLHVQEYAPPKTIDPDKAQQRFRLALQIIRAVFGVEREQVFLKTRARQKGKDQYEKQANQGKFYEVHEGQATFLINLTDYLDTGLFLDHRPLRLRIGKEAAGKRFLNLFAYTGAASIHAALGGAATTTTVDMSATYLEWAKRNLAINGLVPDSHRFIQADCMEWLRYERSQYDLIFLDPPTFSNSKRMQDVLEVQRDHVFMIRACMRRLSPEGTLYFSNNFRRFVLALEELGEFEMEDISKQTIGFDFRRNSHIHHCWRIRHKE